MQANNVNQALKRVGSDEIKRNYTQITGREALERLLAGEEVFSLGGWAWKAINNAILAREYEYANSYESCEIEVDAFLDPEDNDWYVAPPFDARKEMLARPGEWVAKYERTDGWLYFGLDLNEMVVVGSFSINDAVEFNDTNEVPSARSINEAIPLDDADLAKLAAMKANEKGVEA